MKLEAVDVCGVCLHMCVKLISVASTRAVIPRGFTEKAVSLSADCN